MINEIKSKKYTGVYIRTLEDKSKTFYIVYKDPITKKTTRLKIGNSKDGFNETYCHNKRSEILSKLRLGEDLNIPILKKKTKHLSLNDIATKYFNNRRVGGITSSLKNTQYKYDKFYLDSLGLSALNSITKKSIITFKNQLINREYANATINNMVSLGSTIFNYAIKEELYNGVNPFINVDRLKVSNTRLRYLVPSELKLLEDNTKKDEVLYLFVLLAVTTGARLESILSIQKKHIDFGNNIINIYDLKNKSFYSGAISNKVKSILEKNIKQLKKDDYILSYTDNKKIHASSIQKRLSPILNKLFNQELKKDDSANRVVIHTLRHTFASLLAISGTPIFTIQKLMNHKDIKQTMRYAKLSKDSGINAVLKVFD